MREPSRCIGGSDLDSGDRFSRRVAAFLGCGAVGLNNELYDCARAACESPLLPMEATASGSAVAIGIADHAIPRAAAGVMHEAGGVVVGALRAHNICCR